MITAISPPPIQNNSFKCVLIFTLLIWVYQNTHIAGEEACGDGQSLPQVGIFECALQFLGVSGIPHPLI